MTPTAIDKGVNLHGVGLGMGGVLFGAGLIAAGALADITLRIGRLALPEWSMYVLGGVALLIGGVVAAASLSSERCAGCRVHLEYGEAYFPLAAEPNVLMALRDGYIGHLNAVPAVPKNQMKTVLKMNYCPKCSSVAEMWGSKWDSSVERDIAQRRVLAGPNVEPFARLVAAQTAARGEDD